MILLKESEKLEHNLFQSIFKSTKTDNMGKNPTVFNLLKNKNSREFQKLLTCRLDDVGFRHNLTPPQFWSTMSSNLIKQCPANWFFRYIASKDGWQDNAEPLAKASYFLKKTVSLDTAISLAVEKSISYHLQTPGTKPLDEKNIIRSAWTNLQNTVENSDLSTKLMDRSAIAISEVIYGEKINQANCYERVRKSCLKLLNKIHTEINNPQKNHFRVIDDSSVLSFNFNQLKIYLHDSLMIETDDHFINYINLVTNIGAEQTVKTKTALAALHSQQHFGVDKSRIKTTFIATKSDKVADCLARDIDLTETKELIKKDSELLKSYHERLMNGEKWQSVYLASRNSYCSKCQFRAICSSYEKKDIDKFLLKTVKNLLK